MIQVNLIDRRAYQPLELQPITIRFDSVISNAIGIDKSTNLYPNQKTKTTKLERKEWVRNTGLENRRNRIAMTDWCDTLPTDDEAIQLQLLSDLIPQFQSE